MTQPRGSPDRRSNSPTPRSPARTGALVQTPTQCTASTVETTGQEQRPSTTLNNNSTTGRDQTTGSRSNPRRFSVNRCPSGAPCVIGTGRPGLPA